MIPIPRIRKTGKSHPNRNRCMVGVAKITFPARICTPVLEKAAFPMRNRSQRTKEGIKAVFQAEIRTPVSEKPGKPIQIALIHERGPRQNNHKSHPPAETVNLQYRDSQQILRDASRLCGASRQSRLHRTVQNLGRGSQLNRLVDQIAIIRRKLAFRQTVARNRH